MKSNPKDNRKPFDVNEYSNKLFKDGREWMKTMFSKIPDQIRRLLVVLVLLVATVWIVKAFIIPPELKEKGFFRTSAIESELSKPIHYVGNGDCAECHDDVSATKALGYHNGLSCESCHGPGKEHIDDPAEVVLSAPRKRDFCPLCHSYNMSRPTGFPQINPAIHNPLEPCISCHDPHNPEPPEVPHECAACHAQIARTVALSHHVRLECITCHATPEDHKVNPRFVKPSKPTTRQFCAQCHATDCEVKGTPRVDVNQHGERYKCWQCHYPHMPEVNS